MRNFSAKRSTFRGPRPSFGRGNGGFRRNSNSGGSRNRREGYVDPKLFVKKAETVEQVAYEATHKFSDFGLVKQLETNILKKGFENPTPIQDQSIEALMDGKDLVGIANTGTGKTAAFLIPLINKVDLDRTQNVLIITPTRELAMQIQDEFNLLAESMNMDSVLCIGGANIIRQSKRLQQGVSFVIGTPGRLKDLERRGNLRFGKFNNVVLDEVDRMLDMGFINDIRMIISMLPQKRQSLFFSATMPDKIKAVMMDFLKEPVTVSVKTGATSKNVDQDVVKIAGRNKVDVLHELLNQPGFEKVLVFGKTKWGIDKLETALRERGFRVAAIHGNKSQGQRQSALKKLKTDEVQVLLATDVASRGLDIRGVTHVINFDPPQSYDDYVHRIGRTGRADMKGVALTFID
jgi:ATP-dependent RNA helicase RhlE